MQWISHLKSRILDIFRSIDRDDDGRITQKEFIDNVLASSKHCYNTFANGFVNIRTCLQVFT